MSWVCRHLIHVFIGIFLLSIIGMFFILNEAIINQGSISDSRIRSQIDTFSNYMSMHPVLYGLKKTFGDNPYYEKQNYVKNYLFEVTKKNM